MITINSLSIENFRNYREAHITLDKKTEVYFVFGDNGSGKTTILNAINWCLYGNIAFHGVDENKGVRPNWANDSAITKVSMVINFENTKYGLTRTAMMGDNRGRLLVREVSNTNGNSIELTDSSAAALIEGMLPKNIKSLFFLSENFSNEIFSFVGANSLKDNVEKVSEIDTIESAIRHLNIAQRDCVSRIDKNDKDFDDISRLSNLISDNKAAIQNLRSYIDDDCSNKISEHEQGVRECEAILRDSAEYIEIEKQRKIIAEEIEEIEGERLEAELIMQEKFQENYPRLLFEEYIDEYVQGLREASEKGLFPAPVSVGIMNQILETGVCLCGRRISEQERSFLLSKKEEYEKVNELKFLSDGIVKFGDIYDSVIKDFDAYRDAFEKEKNKRKAKELKEIALDNIDERLSKIKINGRSENPSAEKKYHEGRISVWKDRRLKAAQEIVGCEKNINSYNASLRAISARGGGKDKQELLDEREAIEQLGKYLQELKGHVENHIKKKIERGVWDVFSSILPDTQFTGVEIGDGYRFKIKTGIGDAYLSANELSVGEAKTLALALVSTLSKDIGYSDAPLFIDNLFNGIDEAHFGELTKCVESLAKIKQIYITYLYSENETNNMRVSRFFSGESVNRQFKAFKDINSGICDVREAI